jgi:hypothetical protein
VEGTPFPKRDVFFQKSGFIPDFWTLGASIGSFPLLPEFTVKHEDMKKSLKQTNIEPGARLHWNQGARLQRGTLLLRRLRAALDGISGRSLTYEDLSELTGEGKSTLGNWINGEGQPSPEVLLRMMEMLPRSTRDQILSDPDFCRCHPTLEHPRLSHDRVTVSFLKTIISKREGITLVQGEREILTTFVITALGHSCRILSTTGREILGLDSHAPDWFVPVPGVTYIENILSTQRLHEEFEKAWPRISSYKGTLVILNGGWAQLPAFFDRARLLARNCHVIFSDKLRPRHALSGNLSIHIITVAPERAQSEQIKAEIQEL